MVNLTDLLTMLRRPWRASDPEPSAKEKRTAADTPLSESELTAALESVTQERAAAESAIVEAAGRREALLLQPGAEDSILQAGRDIDHGQLTLERLDAIEPNFQARLRVLRDDARRGRWIILRDAYVAAGHRHLHLAGALEAERASWEAAKALVLAEFPDAAKAVLPPWPLPPDGAVAAFPGRLDQLASTVHDPTPGPAFTFRSVENIADEAARTGHIPDGGQLFPELTLLLSREVAVKFPRPTRDAGGKFRDGGTELVLPGPAARAEVQAGRATYVEEDFACR